LTTKVYFGIIPKSKQEETNLMASKNVKLRGKFMWAKVFESNRDMKGFEDAYVDCEGAYTVDFGMTAEEAAKLKAAGSKKGFKEKDGLFWVKLVRKHLHKIPDLGGPPKIYNAKGQPWDSDIDGFIGNGSEGTVSVNVYPAGRMTGTRLDRIQVLNLVEFTDSFVETQGQADVVEDTSVTLSTTELDDDIPF
jgi:hypothetical protein